LSSDGNIYECDFSEDGSGDKYVVPSIRIGILHSFTGTMAGSERSVADITRLFFEDLNQAGGILGKKIKLEYEDGYSDADIFADKARDMINDGIDTVFGCWTSSSRAAVKPVFEELNALLFYPLQYEGQECSKNFFYAGAATNQQLEPSLQWSLRNLYKDFVLIGSDYIYPRTANEVATNYIRSYGGEVYNEVYVPLGGTDVRAFVIMIGALLPNCGTVLNTLNGDSNVAFFTVFEAEFSKLGLNHAQITECWPVMSMSIAEQEVQGIGPALLEGHYAAWNYFSVIETEQNDMFKQWVYNEYGDDITTNDPMESAYLHTLTWSAAVEKANSFDIADIAPAIEGLVLDAPEGTVRAEKNHHLSKSFRIGQVRSDGLFEIVFEQKRMIYPEPWSLFVDSTRGFVCDWSLSDEEAQALNVANTSSSIYPITPGFYQPAHVEVGILHSFTGVMAISEVSVSDTELAVIDMINTAGGVLVNDIYHKLIPVISNGASEPDIFAEKLQELIDRDVAVVFGVWTSSARKAVLPVIEASDKLLYYPIQYEAEECSGSIFYTGATPNQQLSIALDYMISKPEIFSTSFLLTGSDYVFPRTANAIAYNYLVENGRTVVGELYVSLSATEQDIIDLWIR